jgi:hypothetical protein
VGKAALKVVNYVEYLGAVVMYIKTFTVREGLVGVLFELG